MFGTIGTTGTINNKERGDMHLSAEKIAAMEGLRRVHNLNPGAIRNDKSLGDEVGLKNIGIHLISIAPPLRELPEAL